MRLRFLGTGASFGVPVVGCECESCSSEDHRDRRGRHALLLEDDGRRVLIDAPPELRLQLLREGIKDLGAVLISHPHADHIHGLDDLRVFTRGSRRLPMYVPAEFEEELRRRFGYVWSDGPRQPESSVPGLDVMPYGDGDTIQAAGFSIACVRLPHGIHFSYGFRVGRLGILIDANRLPGPARDVFSGIETLVVNALWFGRPHPGHFSMEQAAELGASLGVRRTLITHIAHGTPHAEIARRLPSGSEPSFDGLRVEV